MSTTHTWRRALAALLLSIFLVGGIAQPAMATGHHKPVTTETTSACPKTATSTSNLPVTRWRDSLEIHSRSDGFSSPGAMAKRLQREGTTDVLFAVGGAMWTVTNGVTEMALNFCVLNKVGGLVDSVGADLATRLLESRLIAALVALALVIYIWRVGRGQTKAWSAIAQKGIVLGIFGVMFAGASASTGGGTPSSPDGDYKPGVGSPGWFVTRTDKVVGEAASFPADTLSDVTLGGAEKGAEGRGGLGCAPYVTEMKNRYALQYGPDPLDQARAMAPTTLSTIWENSGLEMWKTAQFGSETVGTVEKQPWDFGDLAYCRLLDTDAGLAPEGVDHKTLAWSRSRDSAVQDRRLIGWAACSAPSHGEDLLSKDDGTAEDLRSACDDFFHQPHWEGEAFDWGDNVGSDVPDYVAHLHGAGSSGFAAGLMYVLSSGVLAVVFTLFAGAILVAKAAALLLMLSIWLVLLRALLPSGSLSLVADQAKAYAGISLLAWGAQLVLGLLALITGLLVQVGNEVVAGGPGGIMSLFWVGTSPIVAVYLMQMLFKKLRIPSPLRLSSARAWGQLAARGEMVPTRPSALLQKARERGVAGAKSTGRKAHRTVIGGRQDEMERPNRIRPKTQTATKTGRPNPSVDRLRQDGHTMGGGEQ